MRLAVMSPKFKRQAPPYSNLSAFPLACAGHSVSEDGSVENRLVGGACRPSGIGIHPRDELSFKPAQGRSIVSCACMWQRKSKACA